MEKKLQPFMELIERAGNSTDTLELIRVIDELYNRLMDPNFESMHGTLEQVLAVTMEDLTEYSWEDFLSEEMYEEVLESYAEQLTNSVSGLENLQLQKKWKKKRQKKRSVKVVTPEMLEKAYTYVELNYGKSYLSEAEEKKINYQMCRGIHK